MKTLAIKIIKPILHILENYRWWIFWFIYSFGVWVYYSMCKLSIIESIYQSLALFAMSIASIPNASQQCTFWLYIVGLLAAFYTAMSVISLVAKKFVETQSVLDVSKHNYILVCGLGEKASAYIESELKDNPNTAILVIEKDRHNANIAKYRNKGVAVKIADAKDRDTVNTLQLVHVTHMVVLAGKDIENMEIALALKDACKKEALTFKNLYMHIAQSGLEKFYKEGGLLDESDTLNIKMFSLYRNAAKSLFLAYDIDGIDRTYIDSDKAFGLVIAGYSTLAIELVGHICELAHFPNENHVTLYCIDTQDHRFQEMVTYKYPHIDKIPYISIEYISINHESKGYYTQPFWKQNITNIMLCSDNVQQNLDIASQLADSTYRQEIYNRSFKTHIHIALYQSHLLSQNISNNNAHFKYFNVFAQTEYMASKDMIIEEKFETLAKCIHAGYATEYNPHVQYGEKQHINEKWNHYARLTDRVSSRAQAYHIPLKLKALGMRIEANIQKDSVSTLLLYNKKLWNKTIIDDELKTLGISEENLKKMTEKSSIREGTFSFFPTSFETMLEKLMRAEHNRWMAHHYLKGWEYNKEETTKALKEHRCLISMPKMDPRDKPSCLYDLYAVLYIPNLLAHTGYALKEEG